MVQRNKYKRQTLTEREFDPHGTRLVSVGLLEDASVPVLVVHATQTEQEVFAVLLQANFAIFSAGVVVGQAVAGS